jgi:SRSO17 transposase
VKQLAMSLPTTTFRDITWREAGERKLRSRFAAVRIRAAHRDYEQAEPHQEEWLLIEWPREEKETHQILGIDAAAHYQAQSFSQDGETPLDHRTGL